MCRSVQSRFLALALSLLLAFGAASGQSPATNSPAPRAAHAGKSAAPKPDARKARHAYQKGLRAEQADDWPAALDAYTEAASYSPTDREILLRRETARFRLVQQFTDRAEREALAGRMDGAREALKAALAIDPGYSVARERLAQFEPPAIEQKPEPELAGAAELRPQPGPRDFDHRGDARSAYETVARAFGLVAAFDPELPTRQVRFRARGVDFAAAMRLLGQQSNTLWRAVNAQTFFVFDNSEAKRRAYAVQVVRTFVLPASTTPDHMTETLRMVRDIAGVSHTELDTRTRTLTIRDTPETIALAAALIQEIEKARGELMLEIEILEVNQTAARRLGITPPDSARVVTFSQQDINEARQSVQGLLNVVTRLFGPPSALAGLSPAQVSALLSSGQIGLGALLPPVVAFGGGRTIFLATPPNGAVADFSEMFQLVRRGRRILLRAQDGQAATFFVGDRFPITLALLGPGIISPVFVPSVSPTQLPRTDIDVGQAPVAIATGDWGNGKLDLAVANRDSNTVSILLSNGDGTFLAKPDLTGFTAPVAVAAADFNGDAKPDLAIVNRDANTVSIFRGEGDGTFTFLADLTGYSTPVAIVAADLNGDGKADLAVVNQGNNSVSILLGNGDVNGTFTSKPAVTVGLAPTAIAAGDFNNDQKLDFAVTNRDSNTVSVFLGSGLGKGDGTYVAAPDLSGGKSPVAVTTANLTGGNNLDLVVANRDDNSVSVFIGKGDGTFNAKSDIPVGTTPLAVAIGDLNVDGREDIAVANSGSNTISVLLGEGDGTFGSRFDVQSGATPSAISTGDLNGDGRSDAVIANQGANTISVILTTVSFVPASGTPQTAYPGSEYEDIGLKVRATPRLHSNDEVTLQMEFEIRSLSGAAVNGIPVISNRTVQQTVRLRENETTLISGIIQRDETRAITGLPGFAYALGHAAGRRDTNLQDTELLILITPRQLRLTPRTDRTIYAGPTPATGTGRPPTQP
jgi:tetratricopeptide (TPR) repeat protein